MNGSVEDKLRLTLCSDRAMETSGVATRADGRCGVLFLQPFFPVIRGLPGSVVPARGIDHGPTSIKAKAPRLARKI